MDDDDDDVEVALAALMGMLPNSSTLSSEAGEAADDKMTNANEDIAMALAGLDNMWTGDDFEGMVNTSPDEEEPDDNEADPSDDLNDNE